MRIDKGAERAREARQKAALREDDVACSAKVKAKIIRMVKGGCTLTEVCARDDMPAWATISEARNADPEFDAQLIAAQHELAEYMLTEGTDYARREAQSDVVDGERQRVMQGYMDVAMKYAAAIAPRRFGAGVKLDIGGDNVPSLQIVAFGQPIATPINPHSGSSNTQAQANAGKAAQGTVAHVVADTGGQAQRDGSTHNRPDRGRRAGRKVQANRNTTRKARRIKGSA